MKNKRITKGAALLKARKLLGPIGHVRFIKGHYFPCVVGTFREYWIGLASGKTWEDALADARKAVAQ